MIAGCALIVFGLFPGLISGPSVALMSGYKPDVINGAKMFDIGGCASCHMTPGQKDRYVLGGGLRLKSKYGVFHVPNISPDQVQGIGGWSEQQFVNAVVRGIGANGRNLYPAFPYPSYQNMKLNDVRDLFAFIRGLPESHKLSEAHELSFPFNVRILLGIWKWLFLRGEAIRPDPSKIQIWTRGGYLVEGPGHCVECHSRRNALGAIIAESRFAGAPAAQGNGWVPNITPSRDGLAKWSARDLAEFLKTGLTPDFDSAGGDMAEVIQNTSRLSNADRMAIATYLKSLPPRSGKKSLSSKW